MGGGPLYCQGRNPRKGSVRHEPPRADDCPAHRLNKGISMRIRTILAAAAAPAALAGVLLGTAGQASAATVPAAPTVAAVHATAQAPNVVIAHTHRSGVPDTTDHAGPGTKDTPNGPQWAT